MQRTTMTKATGRNTAALFAAGLFLASLNVEAAFVPESRLPLSPKRQSGPMPIIQSLPYEKASISESATRLVTVRQPSSPIRLQALPPSVVSAVGHVLGGNLATPFVIDAVKTWYARIPLPSWTPPNGIFGPVWVVLYSMIGVAAARVATLQGWKSPTMILWTAHYLLNLIWAPLFFGMAKLRAACLVNAALVVSMAPILYWYAKLDRTAALLLLPYTAWITFATVLNWAICKLNPMDGKGYSNALLEAAIAKLQKDAAKKVGL